MWYLVSYLLVRFVRSSEGLLSPRDINQEEATNQTRSVPIGNEAGSS